MLALEIDSPRWLSDSATKHVAAMIAMLIRDDGWLQKRCTVFTNTVDLLTSGTKRRKMADGRPRAYSNVASDLKLAILQRLDAANDLEDLSAVSEQLWGIPLRPGCLFSSSVISHNVVNVACEKYKADIAKAVDCALADRGIHRHSIIAEKIYGSL